MPFRRAALLALALIAAAPAAPAQQRVEFPSRDDDLTGGPPTRLDGLMWRPTGDAPAPAIVLMHGCGGLMGRGRVPTARHREWAVRFAALGYVALHVDSFRPRGYDQVCTQPQPNARPGFERARDAYGALLWLQAQPFVDPARIGLMGWSHGGSTTLWTVSAATRARPRDLAHDFVAAVAFYPGCAPAAAWRAGWRTEIPLLVLIGEADDWTPAAGCHALQSVAVARGLPVEFVFYPDAHHGFDAPNQAETVLTGLRTPSGTATVGTQPEARVDAVMRVSAWFRDRLAR
jgi:dienelactone hydrolase